MALPNPVHPIITGRGISTETYGMDSVFPRDDSSTDPETEFV